MNNKNIGADMLMQALAAFVAFAAVQAMLLTRLADRLAR